MPQRSALSTCCVRSMLLRVSTPTSSFENCARLRCSVTPTEPDIRSTVDPSAPADSR
jgi:hypothetical protein